MVNGALLGKQLVSNLRSLRMLALVALSVALIGMQYWTVHHAAYWRWGSKPTFLREVMLFNADGNGSGLYLFMLPFLAALLGGGVLAKERFSGRLYEVLAREGRGTVLRTSVLSGFLLGGIGGSLPLIVNLIAAAIAIPHLSFIDGDAVDHTTGQVLPRYVLIDATSWAYPMYRINQVLLILFIILLVFVVAGLFSAVAVGASFFTRHRYVELLVPFVLSVVWWMMPTLTFYAVPDQWSHNVFLYIAVGNSLPDAALRSWTGIAINVIGLSAIVTFLSFVELSRDVR